MLRLLVLVVVILFAAALPTAENANNGAIPQLDGRIVGGSITDISKHPHQISMRYKGCSTCAFQHRCGGSVISPRIILTAAHCVVNVEANNLQVVAGCNVRNGIGIHAPVAKIISHENFSSGIQYENDIAVLILAVDLPVNGYNIKPIKLADKDSIGGAKSIVTGWGAVTEGGYASDYLLEVEVPIISRTICEDKYGKEKINESMLCAGSEKGGKDACQGDSGGPLVSNNVLVGVVSWGYGCARPEYPGIYANVKYLRSWIDKIVSENS